MEQDLVGKGTDISPISEQFSCLQAFVGRDISIYTLLPIQESWIRAKYFKRLKFKITDGTVKQLIQKKIQDCSVVVECLQRGINPGFKFTCGS